MATSNKISERRVVPRWRPFAEALNSGEVSPSAVATAPKVDVRPFLAEKEGAWLENRTLPFALDLVSATVVLGHSESAKGAAEFVLERSNAAPITALELARKVLGLSSNIQRSSVSANTPDEIRQLLRCFKEKRINQPRSPFVWMDLARLYTLMGQLIPAEQAIRVALALAPSERFVIRSTTRFLLHAGRPDEALNLLRRCRMTDGDPWLVAAELAVSNVVGKPPRFAKSAHSLLSSNSIRPFHLSELAAAMGSLEMTAGSSKKANRLFEMALLAPTDNSLAQVVWAGERTGLGVISSGLLEAPLAHEARTFNEQNNQRWESLVRYATEWAKDESFSARPRLIASGTASSILNDPRAGESIARGGLEANPNHPGLINNLAFALSLQGRMTEALEALHAVNLNSCQINDEICLLATFGLAYFRSRDPIQGKMYYERAIALAMKHKLEKLELRARLYCAREQILSGDKTGIAVFDSSFEKAKGIGRSDLAAVAENLASQIKQDHVVHS